eukprot:7030763-Prymnesium_polylepis.2
MASGSLVGVSASSVSMQKHMHAFHSGVVSLQRKRCMMVSSSLPHSLHWFWGACLCFLLRTNVALCTSLRHCRSSVASGRGVPIEAKSKDLIERNVWSYVALPVFNAAGSLVLGNDGGEVGCDGVYGEVGQFSLLVACYLAREEPAVIPWECGGGGPHDGRAGVGKGLP